MCFIQYGVWMLMAVIGASHVQAQHFPSRPIRVVVPFPAGGTADTNLRGISAQLERQLGQPIVIDNRAGANGIIGTDIVAKSAPDGHTLLYVSSSFALNPLLYKKLPYDAVKDFAPVSRVAGAVGFIIAVNPVMPYKTLSDLLTAAKRNDVKLSYGTPGVGSSMHLGLESLKAHTGASLLHVPYKGVAPAMAALLGNEIQVVMMPPTILVPQIKAGRIHALAFTGAARWPMLPEIPVISETLPGYTIAAGWDGLFAPARTPAAIAHQLQTAFRKTLDNAKLREVLAAGGYDVICDAPEAFRKFLQSEMQRYGELVKKVNIQAE
jgi:tripartite-type tricarboxylate transporter receptor subunit TctC